MSKQAPEGSMYYLNQIFEKFEKQEEKLEKVGKEAQATVTAMMDLIRTKRHDIFKYEDELYKGLDAFKKIMGHTDHLVIYVDLQRQKLSQPEKLAEQALKQAELAGKQQILPATMTATNPEQAGGDHGMWWFLSERRRMVALEKIAQMQKEPQLTTTQRQSDFMNYAKDIPPELNRLYDWLGGTLMRLKLFNCEDTVIACYSQLRTYLEKLSTLTIGFSSAVIDVRKELVGERQVAYAQAMSAMEQARYMAELQVRQPLPFGTGPTYPKPIEVG
jgi:hypothetical protein